MSTLESNESFQYLSKRMSLLSDKLGYRALFEHKKSLQNQKQHFKIFQCAIHRSLPFDWVERILGVYTAVWQAEVQPSFYSSYDPALLSLNFAATDTTVRSADIQLIWVDWRLLNNHETFDKTAHWITEQLKQLRQYTTAPILINNWPQGYLYPFSNLIHAPQNNTYRHWVDQLNQFLNTELPKCVSNTHIIDLNEIALQMGQAFWDIRNDLVSHYPFSDSATIEIAKHIGCQLLPALLGHRKKAIVLDMDETLYHGVLGEDGIDGIMLTEAHIALQHNLKKLKNNGFLLTLCSRNNADDAQLLFEKRSDFVLKWTDFVATRINWESKSNNIQSIANQLNIHYDSFIFIDDNPVELMQVVTTLPGLSCILADHDANATLARLVFTPGIYSLQADTVANKRQHDIQAEVERKELLAQSNGNTQHYLASLNMKVFLYKNNKQHCHRLHDLSQRTNQFNLTQRRLDAAEAEQVMQDNRYCTVTVELTDTLADSGIIGAFCAEIDLTHATLIECIMSCRALGREVETIAFTHLLQALSDRGVQELTIEYKATERNQPAYSWFLKILAACHIAVVENKATMNIESALGYSIPLILELPVSVICETMTQGASVNNDCVT